MSSGIHKNIKKDRGVRNDRIRFSYLYLSLCFYEYSIHFRDTTQNFALPVLFRFTINGSNSNFVTKLRGWFLVFESRMRTMISTASLPFASIECSTVVSEIRFILAIGILSKPQTEKSFGTFVF